MPCFIAIETKRLGALSPNVLGRGALPTSFRLVRVKYLN